MRKEKKVGLALGSGSARGCAHIGVIKALEEAGVRVDCVAGTSIGALVGAIYALGDLDALEAFFLALDKRKFFSYFDFVLPRQGLLDGERLYEVISARVAHTQLEAARMPFCAVACDLMTGEQVLLRSGDVVEAVRASISLPGILTPVRVDGTYLVDGGLVNPVPVDVVREMGADVVIAVDLNHDLLMGRVNGRSPERGEDHEEAPSPPVPSRILAERLRPGSAGQRILQALEQRYQDLSLAMRQRVNRWTSATETEPSIFDVISTSIAIMSKRITEANLLIHPAEVLVQPALGHLGMFDFDHAAEAIEEGYRRMREALPVLQRLLDEE